jgi:predicted enzyme related to lactoylglutathione lyase
MSTTVTETPPQVTSAVIPYLAVADARRAIEWYADVLGAERVGEPIVMPDGRVGHAELTVSGGTLYLADEHPEIGVVAPQRDAAAVSLMLPVSDADAVRARAVAAGATGDRPPYDGYGSRNAWIIDPFGHRWCLQSPLGAPPAPSYQHGDVGYVSLWVPDAARAAAFYPAALGWDIGHEHHYRVQGATPATGLFASPGDPDLYCCYAVDDIRAAVSRVREAGGSAGDIAREPFGEVAECIDNQGTRFAIYEQPADHQGVRPPANGYRAGDLAYLTLEVVDSAKARAFYGAVLGWTFAPGRIADGWQVENCVPMVGLSGGHTRGRAVPMWQVADLDHAVAAVRAAGGTATEPERQPYGRMSDCTDDQGSRFYLGQL